MINRRDQRLALFKFQEAFVGTILRISSGRVDRNEFTKPYARLTPVDFTFETQVPGWAEEELQWWKLEEETVGNN